MAFESATGLIVRTYDWSESSRIVVVWTREFGKVRLLAKGGRRLKSNYEVALDLLTVCSIVWLRRPSHGGLEILTEARAEERFPILRTDLAALNVGYYIAELLGDGTQDYDSHPALYDASLVALRLLASTENERASVAGWFEWAWLSESGHKPITDHCMNCSKEPTDWEGFGKTSFTISGGGVICPDCRSSFVDSCYIATESRKYLADLDRYSLEGWKALPIGQRRQIRQVLSQSVIHYLGRKPKMAILLG